MMLDAVLDIPRCPSCNQPHERMVWGSKDEGLAYTSTCPVTGKVLTLDLPALHRLSQGE